MPDYPPKKAFSKKSLLKFPPTKYEINYGNLQRAKFLHTALLILILGLNMLALINVYAGAGTLAAIMSTSSLFLVVLIALNIKGHHVLTGYIFVFLIYGIATFNLIDGLGLHDPGIIAFPTIMLLATYLNGLWALWSVTMLSIFSVGLVHVFYLSNMGNFIKHGLDHSFIIFITITLIYILTAIVIDRVYNIWQKTLSRLYSSYDSTLEGWAKTLSLRDIETEAHTRRVVNLSLELAMALGINNSIELNRIKHGALLHDIGKISIPDQILFKPGPLTDEEWKIMKQHPVYSQQLIEGIDFLKPLTIPLYHHEYWDGSGYPEGIKGEEIPLEARIFTIIDHYDALCSDRPYRKAWTHDAVITYLEEGIGKLYDPRCARMFIDHVIPHIKQKI